METLADPEDRWAAAEQHLREGEVRLSQLEKVVAEMARHNRAEAGLLAASALVPLRRGVTEMRERLVALRAEQAPPPVSGSAPDAQ
jgi:hypothetical protein